MSRRKQCRGVSSLQELVVLFGEKGVLRGISPHHCWSEQLGRRRSHQKGCYCGFGSALMLQCREKNMNARCGRRGWLLQQLSTCCLTVSACASWSAPISPIAQGYAIPNSQLYQLQVNVVAALCCFPCTVRVSGGYPFPLCRKQTRRTRQGLSRLVKGKSHTCLD